MPENAWHCCNNFCPSSRLSIFTCPSLIDLTIWSSKADNKFFFVNFLNKLLLAALYWEELE